MIIKNVVCFNLQNQDMFKDTSNQQWFNTVINYV